MTFISEQTDMYECKKQKREVQEQCKRVFRGFQGTKNLEFDNITEPSQGEEEEKSWQQYVNARIDDYRRFTHKIN